MRWFLVTSDADIINFCKPKTFGYVIDHEVLTPSECVGVGPYPVDLIAFLNCGSDYRSEPIRFVSDEDGVMTFSGVYSYSITNRWFYPTDCVYPLFFRSDDLFPEYGVAVWKPTSSGSQQCLTLLKTIRNEFNGPIALRPSRFKDYNTIDLFFKDEPECLRFKMSVTEGEITGVYSGSDNSFVATMNGTMSTVGSITAGSITSTKLAPTTGYFNILWHPYPNDGSGSGLDADLLDGLRIRTENGGWRYLADDIAETAYLPYTL